MKKLNKIYFTTEFIIARFLMYGVSVMFYFYLVYFNTASCPESQPCILCNMKTAVWELIHFNIERAFQLNELVSIIILLIVYILLDTILVLHHLLRSLKYQQRQN